MGVIINPRGPGGSGKTELVRRVLARYGWEARRRGAGVTPIHLESRARPIAYRLRHPLGGRSLVVLGHYERACGGCDTIGLADGGLDFVLDWAGRCASEGCDVLLEGRQLSLEYERSSRLAAASVLHVLRLTTPIDVCAKNLAARRRRSRAEGIVARGAVAAEEARVAAACARLNGAVLEALGFDDALRRIENLLRLRRGANPAAGAYGSSSMSQ